MPARVSRATGGESVRGESVAPIWFVCVWFVCVCVCRLFCHDVIRGGYLWRVLFCHDVIRGVSNVTILGVDILLGAGVVFILSQRHNDRERA
jgi:hypothetical protein